MDEEAKIEEEKATLSALLPGRMWRGYESRSWEEFMPPPTPQLVEGVPKGWGGSCAVHSYSETLTSNLRARFEGDFQVDLRRLLPLTTGKGVLQKDGGSVRHLGQLASSYGIPVEGDIPLLQGGDGFVLGTSVVTFGTVPMPLTAATREQAEKSMNYREHLCDCLDCGPVVLCFTMQNHYGMARENNEPYRRLPEDKKHTSFIRFPWFKRVQVRPNHCVTAYGYDCPTGDVRSLRIRCQENMKGAPNDEPGRHLLHPDAIKGFYYVPSNLDKVRFSDSPAVGHREMGSSSVA